MWANDKEVIISLFHTFFRNGLQDLEPGSKPSGGYPKAACRSVTTAFSESTGRSNHVPASSDRRSYNTGGN